jgi:hypothetical protein
MRLTKYFKTYNMLKNLSWNILYACLELFIISVLALTGELVSQTMAPALLVKFTSLSDTDVI